MRYHSSLWNSGKVWPVFVAEVYPTGDCGKELGVYRGYAVSLENGKVLRVLGEKQTDAIEKKCRAAGRLLLPSQ